ncbi:MAG: mRNA surveillance protein pelota [Candidatus Altiarchaeota archaeon]|nr:mRNA surveillance protein pelota [Candidatus Altiarchaeota archaeon]
MNVEFRDLRQGLMRLRIENLDDLWYLGRLVSQGDTVKSKTQRRIKDKDDSRSKGGERITITLTLSVESVEFQPEEHILRVSGKIIGGPEDLVSLGSYHSFSLGEGSTVTVEKEHWSKTDLEAVDFAVKNTLKSKVAVVCMDLGEATFALVLDSRIEYLDLEANIGGKYDLKDREKRKIEYYRSITEYLIQMMAKHNISLFVLAGPGFEKNNLFSHIKESNPDFAAKFVLEDTGSSGRSGVREVLSKQKLQKSLEEMNSVRDMKFMEEILVEISKDSGLGVYGFNEVEAAAKSNAADIVLTTDAVFAASRESFEVLFNIVRSTGGKPHIIDGCGEAGVKLASLGGVAAKLRFRVY